jgi:ribosome-associated heat shock protein Hsp15
MGLRIDKYVWCVRLAKTRSQASEMTAKGKIKLNGSNCKAAKEIKLGDVLSISKNSAVFEYKIVDLLDHRVGAKLVIDYLIDITQPEELEKFRLYNLAQSSYRDNGTGKPTTKDRRDLESFFAWQDEEDPE